MAMRKHLSGPMKMQFTGALSRYAIIELVGLQ
jgi:hypothetical protein